MEVYTEKILPHEKYQDTWRKLKKKIIGLNYFTTYINGELVGDHYSYYYNVLAIDGLLVNEEFRHKGIATSKLEYVVLYYKCPIYLHADNDETTK